MDEHRIRLRGGWEYRRDERSNHPARLTLPTVWELDQPGRAWLSRRFGRPPFDPARQVLYLELDDVPGIRSLLLNGRALVPVSAGTSSYRFALGMLDERNCLELELEYDPTAPLGGASSRPPWGTIALVIRTPNP